MPTIRFLVSCEQAYQVLTKKGETVRRLESALDVKLSLSSFKGKADRILYVSGTAENSSRAIGALVRIWSDDAETFRVKMLIPEPLMIKVVGYRGTSLERLHVKSGAKMEAQKSVLKGSTDRLLVATGVADVLHRAVYFTALIFEDYKFLLHRKTLRNYVPSEEKKMVVLVCDSDYLARLKSGEIKMDINKLQVVGE